MRVIATAGHVDHGKSTLIRALTGMEPDRWAEERRRGLTIDLGFAWTRLHGERFAFVDVPGHERFVPNMLAGVGTAPPVLFVVAADEGWMPQSEEHLSALHALGVRHGLLAVTKADRADPRPALDLARARIAETTLGDVPAVAVSAITGEGLAALRTELGRLAARLPDPDTGADVRLWVDRGFTIRGAGTVVTGTLTAGTLREDDELVLARDGTRVRIRGLQALGEPCREIAAVARVALNLRGIERDRIGRGDALVTPGAWRTGSELDVRLHGAEAADLHRNLVLHLGSAGVGCRVRPLGRDTARLSLAQALPVRRGDRGLVRDPGEHRVPAGAEVLDARPPRLRGRGAARARAAELAGQPRLAPFTALDDVRALGLPATGVRAGGWLADPEVWTNLRQEAPRVLGAWLAADPVSAGMPVEAFRHRLGLPDADLVVPLLAGTGLSVAGGLVTRPGGDLPSTVDRAVRVIERRLAEHPFRAPEADELRALGLGPKELAAAERVGRLTRITGQVVLGPGVFDRAAEVLAGLGVTFTVSEARRALDSTRRVAVPLLEALDEAGMTERLDSGERRIVHKGQ
ncbi:selenocysteine-specific translation elongation factor [Amycolatopsis pithecellobii]|uniref:Selenocysteine-specific elongation factor n=1 Tax=Amycolatopsis pithecellobii TaxID=664692 RepID=A0A6N7YNF4_9PSEU|nr:selenocysteine-specific translation elongation factor [Amycolatopsis pithecellobii]MTD53398.1 selenocysteine-specific translation elongation factor [Amycolatopsis pithecellobii]